MDKDKMKKTYKLFVYGCIGMFASGVLYFPLNYLTNGDHASLTLFSIIFGLSFLFSIGCIIAMIYFLFV